jgi:hypothetical protein
MPRLDPSKVKLQPLRISDGWIVCWNHFYQVEPRSLPRSSAIWVHFSQDMLCLTSPSRGVQIDLGWYGPKSFTMKDYRLVAVEMFDKRSRAKSIRAWDNPLRTFRTKSTAKAAATINEWIEYFDAHPLKSVPFRMF